MQRKGTYYEITAPDNTHGLFGKFESAEEAIEDIKRQCARAKDAGYTNKEKWLIVRVNWCERFTDDGEYIGARSTSYVVDRFDEADIQEDQ